jgi:SOS response regulatory protein OraA/RecX
MKRRLVEKGHPDEEVEMTIRRLAGLGYLDDEAFAARWAEHAAGLKGYGPVRIASERGRPSVKRERPRRPCG